MKWILLVLGCILLVGGGSLGYYWFHRSLIPASISDRVKYGIFYPKGDDSIKIQRSTFKYDSSIGQFSFIADFNGDKLTFGEQATPQNFYTSSDYYSNLITKLGGYYTFQNSSGVINLATDPSVGHQVGVMNAKGTLLFVDSGNNLSDNNWREIFNSLSYMQSK